MRERLASLNEIEKFVRIAKCTAELERARESSRESRLSFLGQKGNSLSFVFRKVLSIVCTSSTCCRRPSTKRSRRRHFRVKVQRTYSAMFVARGGGWHIRVRKCIRGGKGTHACSTGGSVCKSQNRSKDCL